MYTVDKRDKVVEINGFPQSSVGAPIPIVLADEFTASVAFYLQDTPDDWDGAWVRVVDMDTSEKPTAIITFHPCYDHRFGPPNDEAFSGHPLADRGLGPFGSYEVLNSSWIRTLERMNSVHPYHDAQRFIEGKRHFILSFHDSTFECIAENYQIEIHRGSVKEMITRMTEIIINKIS